MNELTPTQAIDKYPELQELFNWSTHDLGIFLKCRILNGYYNRSTRQAIIKEESLLKLIDHTNNQLMSSIFDYKNNNNN